MRRRAKLYPPAQIHLSAQEVAQRWSVSVRTLERWRAAGSGPAWLRLGSGVRYRLADVLAFEEAQLRRPDGS